MGENNLEVWDSIPIEMRPKIRYWLPAAAIDLQDLTQEIENLYKRGFGGVEVVTLSALPEEILNGEDAWGTDNWYRVLKSISATTEKLGMSLDFANGPMWPISMPTIQNADDSGALYELTWGMVKCPTNGQYSGELPEPRIKHEEGTVKVLQVCAYLQNGDGRLITDSYRDLKSNVLIENDKSILNCKLPVKVGVGDWLIFVFYTQPACMKTTGDTHYVIDHLSRQGIKACERYWDEVFDNHHLNGKVNSLFCDSLEYKVSMEWTPEFLNEFEKRRGYSLLPYLPFIGTEKLYPLCDIPGYQLDDDFISERINNDYFEVLTQLYCENHLEPLGKLAENHCMNVRYQVAYNRPFEVERSALFVSIPENEALGRPSMDFQKTMAAAAHLGRKERYSFECAAEFGNAYGQNYEDLFWWVKRSLMSGMNAQVLHGASYSGRYIGKYAVNGQISGTAWPGYEAFGKFVSNYWNRTLSEDDAKGCMDTLARLNAVFRKKAKVDCAIYRQSYRNDGEGDEFCLYTDTGQLTNAGYSYEFVSPYLLDLPVCKVNEGVLDNEGVGYKCLIIPETDLVSLGFLKKVRQLLADGLPVVWIGEKPAGSLFQCEWLTDANRSNWKRELEEIWSDERLIFADSKQVVPDLLRRNGIQPEVILDGRNRLTTATRVDDETNQIYFAVYHYNEIKFTPEEPNPDEFAVSALFKKGTTKGSFERAGLNSRVTVPIKLHGIGNVYLCDPWTGNKSLLDFQKEDEYMAGTIRIEEDELLLFMMEKKTAEELSHQRRSTFGFSLGNTFPVVFESLELQEFMPTAAEETSFLKGVFSEQKQKIRLSSLQPWLKLDEGLRYFSGKGTYHGYADVERIEEGTRLILNLPRVSDTFSVSVNGKQTAFPDQVMNRVDITEQLQEGRNRIEVCVISNLYNQLFHEDMSGPFPVPYHPKQYGIWSDENSECRIEVIR